MRIKKERVENVFVKGTEVTTELWLQCEALSCGSMLRGMPWLWRLPCSPLLPCALQALQDTERGEREPEFCQWQDLTLQPCLPQKQGLLPFPPCCDLGGCKIGSPARANVFVGVSAKSSIKEGFKELRHWLFTYINCLGERKIWKKEQGFWFEDILLKAGVSKQKVSETWNRAQVTLKLRHLPWIW